MKLFITIALFQLITGFTSFAQKIIIEGKVLDAETGKGLPYVSIMLKDLRLGTSSNIQGNFQFKVDSLPVRLVFSHVSYQKKEISVTDNNELIVRLQTGKVIMSEVIIEEDKDDFYLYDLVKRAYFHTQQTSRKLHYGKAFYRQMSKNKDDYSELYEIFYDARFSSIGIEDWAIQEGRYALKVASVSDGYIYNKNFTLLSRVLSVIQPATKDIIQPVSPRVEEQYTLKMEHLLDMDGRKVAVVSFQPKPDLIAPAMEGRLYVDINRLDILKMEGSIINDNLKFISLNTAKSSWKKYRLSFDISYKVGPDSTMVLDHVILNQKFNYYQDGVYMHPVETHAFLTFYEYYQPDRKKRLGGRLVRFGRRDRDVLDVIGYNSTFWQQNPIVKRTPVEEEIIRSFEETHAFGSIYLNNRQQLVLEGNELDDDTLVLRMTKALRQDGYALSGEKVYLHINKPFYVAGDTIWFSAYLTQAASHLLRPSSGVLYVELLDSDQTVIVKKRISLENGRGYSQIDLPGDLPEGSYSLIAYTNWMRNFDHRLFFTRKLNIYGLGLHDEFTSPKRRKKAKVDLQFFAEGNDLIDGIPAIVAFKAVGEDGYHVDVNGSVYDSFDKKVAEFESTHLGMGSFILSPKKDVSYYAVIAGSGNNQRYQLPEVKPEGISIMVNNLKQKGVDLLIKTSLDYHDAEFYLIARLRGVIYYKYKGKFRNRVARVEIPKSKIPDGVLQITLFDINGQPRCERLVFINNYQTPVVSIKTGKARVSNGGATDLWLRLNDSDGKAISNADLSVSVTSALWVPYFRYQENIYSNLLLNADLKGCVEDPGYYFVDDSRERQKALDLVMLTHGWRRFTWDDLLMNDKPEYKYHHQQFLTVTGKAVLKNGGKPASNIYLEFIPLSRSMSGIITSSTDALGRFRLQLSRVQNKTNFAVKAVNVKGKQISVNIVVDTLIFPDERVISNCHPHDVSEHNIPTYLEQDYKIKTTNIHSDSRQDQKIESDKTPGFVPMYKNADVVVDFNDRSNNYGSIIQMLQNVVPGLQVTGSDNNMQISIRGMGLVGKNNPPLIVLDGNILVNPVMTGRDQVYAVKNAQSQQNSNKSADNTNESSNQQAEPNTDTNLMEDISNATSQYSVLSIISPQEISRVEVLKGAAGTGAFGGQGANGVILLYTKGVGDPGSSANDKYKDFDRVVLPGFHHGREFYSPAYNPSRTNGRPVFNPTVLWIPRVNTDRKGRVRLTLDYIDIQKESLRIEVEGITPFGVPVSSMLLTGPKVKQ